MLTDADRYIIAALRACKSDKARARRLGLSLEATRNVVFALRAKLEPAPGETLIDAAARLEVA